MKTIEKTYVSYEEICKYLKSNKDKFGDAIDKFLSLGLIVSAPFVAAIVQDTSSSLKIMTSLLSLKNGIKDFLSGALNKITKKDKEDRNERSEKMLMAYGLIVFSSFFEAANDLDKDFMKKVGIKTDEKNIICTESLDKQIKFDEKENIYLPHPAKMQKYKDYITNIYKQLSINLLFFIKGLAVFEDLKEPEKTQLEKKVDKLPEEAIKIFHNQYLDLCLKFNEFSRWADIRVHNEIKDKIEEAKTTIDIGFKKVSQDIAEIPNRTLTQNAHCAINELEKIYQSAILEPVFKTNTENDKWDGLSFPKKVDSFIPQSFKHFVYSKEENLENEKLWNDLSVNNNLAEFLENYFSSPYSNDSPLIILGLPGSGKSLLCDMLAAQVFQKNYSPVLVKLRDIDAGKRIHEQIIEQIGFSTTRTNLQWADIGNSVDNSLIIFDGFDELLQIKSKEYNNYIHDIVEFQKSEISMGRITKCLITSRITLMDKVYIPKGSTIIKLMDFEKDKIDCWVDIWNEHNSKYFIDKNIKPLKIENENVTNIASQPLILLMLALYDSEKNELALQDTLNRSLLYYNIFKTFIERELTKGKKLSKETLDKETNIEFNRLGVVAIGMFNRNSLHIRENELNKDIEFYEIQKNIDISEASALLGSFFFINKSQLKDKTQIKENAYEFLHNTFGEFLAANFLLNQLFELISYEIKNYSGNIKTKYKEEEAKTIYVSLMNTPLFSRPLVLDLMEEWFPHFLEIHGIKENDFVLHIERIIANEINRVFKSNMNPKIMLEELKENPYKLKPLLEHNAILILNLLLIRLYTINDRYEFLNGADSLSLWDKVINLWKIVFSESDLNKLSEKINCSFEKNKNEINEENPETIFLLKKNKKEPPKDILNMILYTADALGDKKTKALTILAKSETKNYKNYSVYEACNLLNLNKNKNEGDELYFLIRYKEFLNIFSEGLETNRYDELFDRGMNLLIKSIREDFYYISLNIMNILKSIATYELTSKYNFDFFKIMKHTNQIKLMREYEWGKNHSFRNNIYFEYECFLIEMGFYSYEYIVNIISDLNKILDEYKFVGKYKNNITNIGIKYKNNIANIGINSIYKLLNATLKNLNYYHNNLKKPGVLLDLIYNIFNKLMNLETNITLQFIELLIGYYYIFELYDMERMFIKDIFIPLFNVFNNNDIRILPKNIYNKLLKMNKEIEKQEKAN